MEYNHGGLEDHFPFQAGDFQGVAKLPSSLGWITTTSYPRRRGVLWEQHLCQVPVWFLVVKSHEGGTLFDDFLHAFCLFV